MQHPYPRIVERMKKNQATDLCELLSRSAIASLKGNRVDIDQLAERYVLDSKNLRDRYAIVASMPFLDFARSLASGLEKGDLVIDFLNLERLVLLIVASGYEVIDDYDDLVSKSILVLKKGNFAGPRKELLFSIQEMLRNSVNLYEQSKEDVKKYLKKVLTR